jgi:hypothetical protein
MNLLLSFKVSCERLNGTRRELALTLYGAHKEKNILQLSNLQEPEEDLDVA